MKIFKILDHNSITFIDKIRLKALIKICKTDDNYSSNDGFLNYLKKELSELKYLKWRDKNV
jgi:hypothetical protein